MKRSTLSILVVVLIALVAVSTAQASMLSEMLFGRHRTYFTPGMTFSVDEKLPAEWQGNAALGTRYWNGETPIFQGTRLEIGIIIESGNPSEREFRIYRTDRRKVVNLTDKPAKNRLESEIGGMSLLGEFRGKYGFVIMDTLDIDPGTIFLYTYVKQRGKYELFSEKALALRIAPPLTEVIPVMENASDTDLRAWGLEKYVTSQEIITQELDRTPWEGKVLFADGGHITGRLYGTPREGCIIGVFTRDCLEGVAKVDRIEGNLVRSSSSSRFLKPFTRSVSDLRLDYVVAGRSFAVTRARELTPEQSRNLATFPNGPAGSDTFGLRNAVYEMATAPRPVMHLGLPYADRKGKPYVSAAEIWYRYQEFTKTMVSYTLAPEVYVPVKRVKEMRQIRLANGMTVLSVDKSTVSRLDTQGWVSAMAYVVGQRVRRPDNLRVNAYGGSGGTAYGGAGGSVGPITNNNANVNTNVNPNNTTINLGPGSANGYANGYGTGTGIAGGN